MSDLDPYSQMQFTSRMKATFIISATLSLCLWTNLAHSQTELAKFIPFDTFIGQVRDANANDFLARPTSKVKDAASFEDMRHQILSLYEGVHVAHSYVFGLQTFDCVPVNEQPSLRGLYNGKIASEPPPGAGSVSSRPKRLPAVPNQMGNGVSCEANTIPMRRITLEQLSHFRTWRDFVRKAPR